MKDRIKKIRDDANINMRDFAERLGVSHGAISLIESGKRGITDQMVKSICREFSVNEKWLRTGEGEMYQPLPFEAELGRLTAEIMKEADQKKQAFAETLLKLVSTMTVEQWEVITEFIKKCNE